MAQRGRILLGIVGLCAISCAAAAEERDPEMGIRLSETASLSPFIDAAFTYDSNVPLNPYGSEVDDFYWNAVGGLSYLRHTDDHSLSVRGWYQIRRYLELTEYDDDTWQENAELVTGHRDRLELTVRQRYGELSDYEFTQSDLGSLRERGDPTHRLIETRTRRVKRGLDDISVAVAREMRLFEVDASINYSAVAFREEDFRFYDWDERHADLGIDFLLSEKTSLTFDGEYGQQETDNLLRNISYGKIRLGIMMVPSERTRLSLSGGIEQHDAGSGISDELYTTILHFDAKGTWAATEKITVQFYGRNEMLPTSAFEINTKRVDQGSVGMVYEISRDLYTTIGVSYRQDDYTLPIGGVDAVEELKGLQWRVRYVTEKRRLALYAKLRYEQFTSNIQEDYDQLRVTAGLTVAY